jgi:hypothetical protein
MQVAIIIMHGFILAKIRHSMTGIASERHQTTNAILTRKTPEGNRLQTRGLSLCSLKDMDYYRCNLVCTSL